MKSPLFDTFDVQRKYGNISSVMPMIQGYKDLDVKKLYDGNNVKKWAVIPRQAEKRLRVLDAADRLETLTLLPSNRFEALRGNRSGQYSIRINDKWRICFTWPNDAEWPCGVEIVDYH
ncbi:MAG: type II toxin-antitoxin system RelE/ParE family toxin [Synergistaceae bacterium]|jgi:proteic killer suppression protein|nr:type II toxin-antitoxin system RelE/ParE family toxin [Synergistaceae bacterium]